MEKDMPKQGIVVAGSLIADMFHQIDNYPKEGFLTNVRRIEGQPGGTGNILQDLAKLDADLPLTVSAILGDDRAGDLVMERLSSYPNMDLSSVQRRGTTSSTLVMNAQDTKQRTFFYIPASSDEYDMSCIDWENLHASIFLLEYILLMKNVDAPDPEYGTHGARILAEARRRGMETSIDIVSEQSQRVQGIVRSALRYTDYCSINEAEAQNVTGVDLTSSPETMKANAQKALEALREAGVAKWAVIHSPSCGFGLDCRTGQYVCVPSLRLPKGYIKGSNGAGDAFCSGILYAAWRGDPLETALRLANACAACSLSEENGSDGLRPYAKVLEEARRLEEMAGHHNY